MSRFGCLNDVTESTARVYQVDAKLLTHTTDQNFNGIPGEPEDVASFTRVVDTIAEPWTIETFAGVRRDPEFTLTWKAFPIPWAPLTTAVRACPS